MRESRPLCVAAISIGREGRGKLRSNGARLALAKEVLREARRAGAHLAILPAGFLRARSGRDVSRTARRLRAAVRGERIAVIVGIDAVDPGKRGAPKSHPGAKKRRGPHVSRGALPYFVSWWAPGGRLDVAPQRSVARADSGRACGEHERRSLRVRGKTVDIVACGELFNARIRENILASSPKASVVAIPVHVTAGFRFSTAMRTIAQNGTAAILCGHQKTGGGHAWLPGDRAGRRDSHPIPMGQACVAIFSVHGS